MFLKQVTIIFVCLSLVVNSNSDGSRSPRFISWLFGPRCGVCPPRFCEDDPAVVLGYCCGCRPPHLQEFLPVECPPPQFLICPIDGIKLCEDFEYMMACCCS